MSRETRASPRLSDIITASPLVSEPSPLDIIEALGPERARALVPLTMLYQYGVANLPEKAATKLVQTYAKKEQSQAEIYSNILERINDFLDDVKVGPSTEAEIWVPIAEIHRPKVDGCVATFEKTSTSSHEHSISIKIFGIGGGYSKSRKFGTTDTIEASGNCLQIVVPVNVKWKPCQRGAEKFTRVDIEDIRNEPVGKELTAAADGCGVPIDTVKKLASSWRTYPVPPKATHTCTLAVDAGQGAEISLESKVGPLDIGPKITVKYTMETKYSYKLAGPHEYLAYLPKNKLAYNWTCLS